MNFKYDFVHHRKIFFMFSAIITIAGILCLFIFKLNLGLDFSSGTRVQITSDHRLNDIDIKNDFEKMGLKPESVVLSGAKDNIASVSFKGVLSKEEIAKVKEQYGDKNTNANTVDPMIGRELARNALFAVLIASIGIIIYVSIRFEWLMALASIIALLHDAFMIIAIFSILRLEVDLTFVAAVLTIVGYSINDTIVVFDRIRENMKLSKVKTSEQLAKVINDSILQTFTRSINTVLTVVIAALALLIFGSESIRNFSIALLIGLVFGAYSSICIASQVWFVWKSKQMKKQKLKPATNKA